MIIHDSFEQGSPEWFKQRGGRPTASRFSDLVTPTGKPSSSVRRYAAELAAETWSGEPLQDFQGNGYTDRGQALEPEARLFYEMQKSCDVREVGFVTDDLMRYGCSPDGLVESQNGGVEFKCLKSDKHILALADIAGGKCPDDYFPQVQGEILSCELDWVDLVVYHPDLPSGILRVLPQDHYQDLLKKQITTCILQRDQFIKMMETL